MYCTHFGLHRLPFNNTPDPTFYYSTPDHEEALATLQYAAQQRKGFVLVTGEVGAGKTLIGRMFLRQTDATARTAILTNTHLNGRQLLGALCSEFGIETDPRQGNPELVQKLQDYLLEQFAQDRCVVVLVDEAQNMPDEAFEELRMLGNLEADDAKLLQVCILGQPELRERFGQAGMRQLEQRLFRRFHLPALSREQTAEYIRHRLGVAGGQEDLFTPEAIDSIHAAARGIPRTINQICDNAMLSAYGQDLATIDATLVEQVREREGAAGDCEQRGCAPEPGGAYPIHPSPTAGLAELATEEARRMNAHISSMERHNLVERSEIERIVTRQNELQKIVGGATTRWLAAQEKLQSYRNEIQSGIAEAIACASRTQQQLDELARTTASAEEIEEIRAMHLRETERVLALVEQQRAEIVDLRQQAEKCWGETLHRIEALAGTAATRDALQKVAFEQQESIGALTADLLERLAQCDAAVRRDLASRGEVEDVRLALQSQAADLLERVSQFDTTLRQDLASRREVEDVRLALQSQAADLLERVSQSDATLRQDLASRREVEDARLALQSQARDLLERLAQSDAALRRDLAPQGEVVEVRLALQAQADGLGEQIGALAGEIAQTSSRLEDARQVLERLSTSTATRTEICELQTRVEAELEKLREESAGHGALAQRHADHLNALVAQVGSAATHVGEMQREISALAAAAATEDQLSELQCRQDEELGAMLARMAEDGELARKKYEGVLDECRRIREEVEQLRARQVDPGEIAELQNRQREDIAAAMARLDQQAQGLELLHARLGSQQSAHQRWVEGHDRRLDALWQTLESVSRSLVDSEVLVDVRRSAAEGLADLGRRVAALEEAERPQPFKIDLAPDVMRDLQQLIQHADQQRAQLTAGLEQSGEVATHLHTTSADARDVVREWKSAADQVRDESQQLRASAEMAAGILKAMKRCHDALDSKLNSHRWQTELTRGEDLARRLETSVNDARNVCRQLIAALHDFDACRTDVEAWSQRRQETAQVAQQLTRLLSDAQTASANIEHTVENRKRLLAAIARNTSGLVEVIQAARLDDEQRRPTPGTAKVSTTPAVRASPTVERIRFPEVTMHVG